MSKEAWGYAREGADAETAFLAGVVDVYADRLDAFCPHLFSLDMDIFRAADGDIPALTEAVRRRLYSYGREVGNAPDWVTEQVIDKLELQLERRAWTGSIAEQFNGYLSDRDTPPEKLGKLREASRDFARALEWHLGAPLCLYVPKKLPDEAVGVLGCTYLSMAFDYFFIGFREYAVLFIYGSVE